jgi:hypothetical protein
MLLSCELDTPEFLLHFCVWDSVFVNLFFLTNVKRVIAKEP